MTRSLPLPVLTCALNMLGAFSERAREIAQGVRGLPFVASVDGEDFAVGRDDGGAQRVYDLICFWVVGETKISGRAFDLLRLAGGKFPVRELFIRVVAGVRRAVAA